MPATSGNPCLMAGTGTPCDRTSYHRHHLILQQTLRKHGHGALTYDRRNLVVLCLRHHQRHHSGHERVPRDLLPAEAFKFADEVGLRWNLDRHYPIGFTAAAEHWKAAHPCISAPSS